MYELESIRDALLSRPSVVTDHELLGAFLGKGVRAGKKKADLKRNLTAVKFARELLEQAGSLAELVRTIGPDTLDHYGVGEVLGQRLIAGAELAIRFDYNPLTAGDLTLDSAKAEVEIQDGDYLSPDQQQHNAYRELIIRHIFAAPENLTEGELLAVLISERWLDFEATEKVLAVGTPIGEFIRSLNGGSLARYGLKRKEGCRLIAACEIAKRYHRRVHGELREIVTELPLAMLALGEQLLEAIATSPQPNLIAKAANLFRVAQDIISEVVTDRRTDIPDMEAFQRALTESGSKERKA